MYIKIPDGPTINIDGSGGLYSSFGSYYQKFITETGSDPDIECTIEELDPDPETVLGGPDDYYGRAGEDFIIKDGPNEILVNSDLSRISASPSTNKHFFSELLEYKIRLYKAEKSQAFLHASAVHVDGKTFVFPAWRHTGKTNTLLSILDRFGGSYLSDDRVWVSTEGTVHGHPLPVYLLPYNYNSFPELLDSGLLDRTSEIVSKVTQDRHSFLPRALYYFNQFYIEPKASNSELIESIFPNVSYKNTASIDNIVVLLTDPDRTAEPVIEHMDQKTCADFIARISQYEWNKNIEEYASAYEFLFDSTGALSRVEELKNKEKEIFQQFVAEADTHSLKIPREEKWINRDLSEKITNELNTIK